MYLRSGRGSAGLADCLRRQQACASGENTGTKDPPATQSTLRAWGSRSHGFPAETLICCETSLAFIHSG